MPDPIDSSRWADVPTHDARFSSVTSEYDRANRLQMIVDRTRAGQRPNARVLGWAAINFLGLVILWGAWRVAHAATGDFMVEDNAGPLLSWAAIVTGVASLLAMQPAFASIRVGVLGALFLTSCAVSGGYVYLVIESHANAAAGQPERSFASYWSRGRGPFRITQPIHQRADGTVIESGVQEVPVPHGTTCELVQRLDGAYGFRWIRVRERSQPSASGIMWPIRREHCFGDQPVSSLSG